MEIWIAISNPCDTCPAGTVAAFSREPTKEQIDGLEQAAGGMFCISTHVYRVELDGKPIDQDEKL